MRPLALKTLLDSVQLQTKVPKQVVVVDGSTNNETKTILEQSGLLPLVDYFLVDKENRGLTRQRNFGVQQVTASIDLVCFLDDDIVVEKDYFEQLENTYHQFPDAIGAGGVDMVENKYFQKQPGRAYSHFNFYELDGWVAKESSRYKARKLVGLLPSLPPYIIPPYSHGRTGLPPNGKIYPVEHFMGGIGSYKKDLFNHIGFSKYFEGYGLYEDFDFCVRALAYGKLYVNTNARVWHHHEAAGRPDMNKYGKMVVRNGWYVWRMRFPKPGMAARFKWNATVLLLAFIRLTNVATGPERKNALAEFSGRVAAWSQLLVGRRLNRK